MRILEMLRTDRVAFSHYIRCPLDKSENSDEVVEDSSELISYKYMFLCKILDNIPQKVLRHLKMRINLTDEFKDDFISILKSKIPNDISSIVFADQKMRVRYRRYEEIE